MRSWATLPFDHPLDHVYVGLEELDETRATSHLIVWWLHYYKNKPVELIQQFHSYKNPSNEAKARRLNFYLKMGEFMEYAEKEPFIYMKGVPKLKDASYYYTANKNLLFFTSRIRPVFKSLTLHPVWCIVREAMRKELNKYIQRMESGDYELLI